MRGRSRAQILRISLPDRVTRRSMLAPCESLGAGSPMGVGREEEALLVRCSACEDRDACPRAARGLSNEAFARGATSSSSAVSSAIHTLVSLPSFVKKSLQFCLNLTSDHRLLEMLPKTASNLVFTCFLNSLMNSLMCREMDGILLGAFSSEASRCLYLGFVEPNEIFDDFSS